MGYEVFLYWDNGGRANFGSHIEELVANIRT